MKPVHLRLYLTGRTVSAERAREALAEVERRANAQWGTGTVITEIIDVLDSPEAAARDEVFATPTLMRVTPEPRIRLFGDLSSATKLMAGLRLTGGTKFGGARPVAPARATDEDKHAWSQRMTPPATSSSPAAVQE
jgi:circadian clock protein KaiB